MRRRTLGFYIAGRFLLTIVGTLLLCLMLIFMIDYVELLRQSSKSGSISSLRLAWIAVLRLPAYSEFLLGFATLVGAIGALLMLSRKSELMVMRAAGMSAWQFLKPGVWVAFILGVLSVALYNPMAAAGRERAEQLFAETFGRESNMLRSQGSGWWLRQDGADGQSVITAGHAAAREPVLTAVIAFVYDHEGRFNERIDAARAELKDGFWHLSDAWVTRLGREPERFQNYLLSTYLTPERVADALGSTISVSFWDLPGLIEVAEKAKLSSARLRVQYELLLSRPLLLAAMVLLGATVSLRSFRFGKIQTMVVAGMLGGFGFFLLSEVSRQIGVAGLAPAWASVWLPVVLVIFVSLTVLLHQEDG